MSFSLNTTKDILRSYERRSIMRFHEFRQIGNRGVVSGALFSLLTPEIMATQIEQESSEYSFMFKALGPLLMQKLPTLVAEGQIKTLAKSLIAEPRLDDYRKLHWSYPQVRAATDSR